MTISNWKRQKSSLLGMLTVLSFRYETDDEKSKMKRLFLKQSFIKKFVF